MVVNFHVTLTHDQKSHATTQGVIDYIFNFFLKKTDFFSFKN